MPVKHAMVRVLLSLVEREDVLPILVEHQVVSVLSSVIRPGIEGPDSKVCPSASITVVCSPLAWALYAFAMGSCAEGRHFIV